jgi:phosphatidate cytidylyltransferase
LPISRDDPAVLAVSLRRGKQARSKRRRQGFKTMSGLAQRLLVFFIGIPLIIGLVLFLPFHRHLALNIAVILFSSLGAVEFSLMLEKKHLRITKTEACIFGALAPAAVTLTVSFSFPEWVIPLILMGGSLWVLLSGVFSAGNKIETATNQLAAGFSILVYPGFFMYWIVKMNVWENENMDAGVIILIFLMVTFACDSLAWLFGKLFGGHNRGIIPVSPNKSVAGFIGAIVGPAAVALCAALIVPNVFVTRIETVPVLVQASLLGAVTGIAAELGDLAESAIKRSCSVKDSGNLMLGRGGVLDSIDSIAVAAPVFFLLFSTLFASS